MVGYIYQGAIVSNTTRFRNTLIDINIMGEHFGTSLSNTIAGSGGTGFDMNRDADAWKDWNPLSPGTVHMYEDLREGHRNGWWGGGGG